MPKYDPAAHAERSRKGPCFVCAYLSGHADYEHEPIYADDHVVGFLSRYPTLLGYTIVAPRAHVVDVTGDRKLFRRVNDVVHDVAEGPEDGAPDRADIPHVAGQPSGQRPCALARRTPAARCALRAAAVPSCDGREWCPRSHARRTESARSRNSVRTESSGGDIG